MHVKCPNIYSSCDGRVALFQKGKTFLRDNDIQEAQVNSTVTHTGSIFRTRKSWNTSVYINMLKNATAKLNIPFPKCSLDFSITTGTKK